MKKVLLSLVAALAIGAGSASAQSPELTLSYGGYTQMDACNNHDGWNHVNNAWGALNVGLNFNVLPRLWIGPSYTFSSTTTKGGPHHSNIAYHGILLNGRYEYYRNSIVKLYGHLGIGAVISHMMPYGHDAYNKAYFGMQISPLGAQVDLSRQWSIFGELGFGVQGLVQVGGKLRF